MIDSTSEDIKKDYEILLNELNSFSNYLSKKKKIIGISKIDLLSTEDVKKIKTKLEKMFNEEIILFSAVSGLNIQKLIDMLWKNLNP
jgi:GTP-binding protein